MLASRPWATSADVRTYLEAWNRAAKWAAYMQSTAGKAKVLACEQLTDPEEVSAMYDRMVAESLQPEVAA